MNGLTSSFKLKCTHVQFRVQWQEKLQQSDLRWNLCWNSDVFSLCRGPPPSLLAGCSIVHKPVLLYANRWAKLKTWSQINVSQRWFLSVSNLMLWNGADASCRSRHPQNRLGFGLKLTGSNILQAPPPNVHKTNNKTDHDKQLTFSGPQ